MFFAVVVEDFDQGVEIHVLVSVVVNEKSFSDNTHEPCGSNRSKPISAAFLNVLAGLFTLPTVPNVGVSRVLSHVAYLVVFGEKNATVATVANKRENAAHPFAASVAFRCAVV